MRYFYEVAALLAAVLELACALAYPAGIALALYALRS
jgi:hypothetical protein